MCKHITEHVKIGIIQRKLKTKVSYFTNNIIQFVHNVCCPSRSRRSHLLSPGRTFEFTVKTEWTSWGTGGANQMFDVRSLKVSEAMLVMWRVINRDDVFVFCALLLCNDCVIHKRVFPSPNFFDGWSTFTPTSVA